ncbi:hypothetical protein P4U44_13600 [Alkalihalobacillus alcalophilus]|nr:hypothetical protein [Alkalihalobacillus alcalophilus]MED1562909.1 hypothetical protein [Alkalihalobacillus alcalophilus]
MKTQMKFLICLLVFSIMFIGAWYMDNENRYLDEADGRFQIQQLNGERVKKERLPPRQYIKVVPKQVEELEKESRD